MKHLLRVHFGRAYFVKIKFFLLKVLWIKLKDSWNSMMKLINNTKSAMRLINNSKNKLNNSKRQMLTNTP